MFAAACTFTGSNGGEADKTEPTPAEEDVDSAAALSAEVKLYVPPNSMEPDTVSADTMGEVLVDETLPDGTRIVCCREPGSELTKYWAVRREDTLIRFCVEERAHTAAITAWSPFQMCWGRAAFGSWHPGGPAFETDLYLAANGGAAGLTLLADGGSVEGSASMSGGIDRGNLLKKLTYTPRENGYTGSGRTLQLRVGNQETSYSEFYEGTNLVAILAVLERAIMKPPVLRMSC